MKASIECYPCLLGQVLSTVNLCALDASEKKDVMIRALDVLSTSASTEDLYPQQILVQVNDYIRQHYTDLGKPFDPYFEIKARSRETAREFYETIRGQSEAADDPVGFAVKCAALGNIIDFGAKAQGGLDVAAELARVHELDFSIYDFAQLRGCLEKAQQLLYLGDNVGEDIFDKALISLLKQSYPGISVVFAVREQPVINDATLEDADGIGMGEVARVISSGSIYPGTILPETTLQFQQLFRESDLIISKGQGNFETLNDVPHPNLFFLLRAKCTKVAAALDVKMGAMVLKKR